MIRDCTNADFGVMDAIINEAALAYCGAIPADCWHEPYDGTLIGVVGLQRVKDATLIRHAYVRAQHQGKGIGSELLRWLQRAS